jgi:hypothetical protein
MQTTSSQRQACLQESLATRTRFGRPAWLLVTATLVILGGRPLPTLVAEQQPAVSLRAAIVDLMETFGDRYPNGNRYLAELDRIESRLSQATLVARKHVEDELQSLKRRVLVAKPHKRRSKHRRTESHAQFRES